MGCGDLVVLRGILRGATNPGSRLTDKGVPIVSYQRIRSACPRVRLITVDRARPIVPMENCLMVIPRPVIMTL